MKNKILASLLVICVCLSCVLLSSPLKTNPVSAADSQSAVSEEVLKTRFLNMLNHNYVYGESFYDIESMVNDSMPALLHLRDAEDEDFIKEEYVKEYILNMFGTELGDIGEINADFPKKDGFVFIMPRGFSVYKHEILKITENEDGSYSVTSKILINPHDSSEENLICETLFEKNHKSSFGYTIMYSKISENVAAM
ncbi:MAG: hypothetical protein IJN15_00170 [Clostridia bacterium]|nr:hypothetical protein [Clostridia bacterium]